MKNKLITILLITISLVISILYTPNKVCNAETYSTAKGMCILESNSGRVLLDKNKDLKLAMASTTKIVTAITAIEHLNNDLDTKYIVPDKAVGIEGTSMYLRYGEEITKRELLYGLMLPSGNDAATALALLTCTSEQEFCALMKETAIKVGALNTDFANAHGLDADGHYTTAYDLALITSYALKNPIFREISKTKNIIIEPTNKSDIRYLRNKNKLLHSMPNSCIGVKTGFTDNAGRCFVSAFEKNNLQMVCVVLNCGPMFEESANLISDAFNKYEMVDILKPNSYLTSLQVKDGDKNFARIYNIEGFSYPLNAEEKKLLEIKYDIPNELIAPIDDKKIIGKVQIFINNYLIFESNICSIDNVKKIKDHEAIEDIIDKWI